MEQQVFDLDNLPRTYFKQALPVVLGMVVTLIYNLADTFFIAQTGDTALVAGVSLCGPVFTALMAFGNIYGQGGSSLISRLLGRQDADGVRRVSAFCFYVAILTGFVLAVPMLLLRGPLLTLIGADAGTLPHAAQYFSILAAGAPFIILSFIHSNLLRCEGMATESMFGTASGAVSGFAGRAGRGGPFEHGAGAGAVWGCLFFAAGRCSAAAVAGIAQWKTQRDCPLCAGASGL